MRPWPPVPHRAASWLPSLLLALAVAAVVAVVGTPFRTARVFGTVRDAANGQSIPGAQVEVAGAPVSLHGGAFALSLPPGDWTLQARAPGFGAAQARLDTRRAYPRRLHITLDLPPLELAVQVQDARTSRPLAGAHIQAGGQPCTTDDEGMCRWLRLHGPIALRAEAEGFLPAEQHLSAAETLHHQQAHNALAMGLEPRCLRVQVRDGQGRPLPGAQVLAAGRADTADAAGQATFCRVPASVEVRVQAEGFVPWQGQWQEQGQDPSPLLAVHLSPRRTPGQVLAADLLVPIADARVTAGAQEVRTAPDGTFSLERLRQGEAGQVLAEGYEPLSWTYTGQERLEFRLWPLPMVVQVRDVLTGGPVRGAWVGTGAGWAQTDAAGQATLLRVAPGEPVRVHAEGYLPGTAAPQAERLAAASLLPLTLQGTVRDGETGQPVPRARLYTPMGLVRTDEAGRYRLAGYTSPPTVEVLAAGYRRTAFRLDPASLEAALPASKEAGRVAVRPAEGGAELDLLLARHAVHALYIPLGRLSDPAAVRDLLRLAWESDLNGVVVDVKGDKGRLAFRPRNRIAQEAGAFRSDLMDLREVLAFCKEHGLYTVARMVVFKDPVLAAARPEWALRHPDGTLWLDRGGAAWVNPYLEEVWAYNLALAREVADLGFDEIQLDYVRFPSDGQVGAIHYGQESTRETRTAAIRGFMRAFAEALEDKAVFTAVDVFGLTVTVHPESDMGIGQRVMDVAPYVDYLCPMVYPSTFAPGNLGLEDPYASPYQVVFRCVQEAGRRMPAGTRVRPWLQYYFYGPDDLREQMQAAAAAGGWGWMFWNSRANYIFPLVFTFRQAE